MMTKMDRVATNLRLLFLTGIHSTADQLGSLKLLTIRAGCDHQTLKAI